MSNFNPEKYAPDYGWWDSSFKDAGAILGFDIDNIYFSGFSSQGDGACFTGSMRYVKGAHRKIREEYPTATELHDIADRWRHLQSRNFYAIRGTVRQRGRYSHSGSTEFEWSDERHDYGWTTEAFDEDEAKEICRDFMGWIYRQLEAEYDYQQAWELARAWVDLRDEIKEVRKGVISIMRSMMDTPVPEGPLKDVLEGRLRSDMDTRLSLMQEREAIAEHFYYRQDGKSVDIQTFAAGHV